MTLEDWAASWLLSAQSGPQALTPHGVVAGSGQLGSSKWNGYVFESIFEFQFFYKGS